MWWVVLALPVEHFAIWKSVKASFINFPQLNVCLESVSKCALGTENFNLTTGNMVEMSRYHKKLMIFRKQKKV